MWAVRTENLSKTFGTVNALDQIDLRIPQGMIFGFLGPNGSGKTTTIRLLLGLLQADAGQAEVLGLDPACQGDQVRLRCGALLEHTGLYERLSAQDNLDFYGQVWHLPAKERRARIQNLLTSLGLWERRLEPCGQWSRGMKQKLAIARALIHQPELVFLDEPTAGLDAVAAAALHQVLLELVQNQGTTVFLTTHNLAEAEKLCGRLAVINRGKLLMEGTPEQLRLSQSANRLEVVGNGFTQALLEALQVQEGVVNLSLRGSTLSIDLNGNLDTAGLVSLMVTKGVQVEEVRKGMASLEEAFLEMVNHE